MRSRCSACLVVAAVLIALTAAAALDGHRGSAQDTPASELLLEATLGSGEYPVAPAFVRLLRISLEPEASSPLHTHPGPEIALIEQGTAAIQVAGTALVSTAGEAEVAGTPSPQSEAPVDSEFELVAGDQIVYLPQTAMTFRNGATDPLVMLTAVLLPAGHQHPEGVDYVNENPDASAFAGVTPEILGDGIATSMPTGGATVTVERLRLAAGEPIPAFDEPVMLSLESGVLDFTVIGGKVQVSRAASPGPQADSAPQTDVSLSKGDAIFFPLGMNEVDRSESDGELVLLRMTITATDQSQRPTPTEEGVGTIEVFIAEPTATAAPTQPSGSPTAAADATTAPDDGLGAGDQVEVSADGVNLRAAPGTDSEVVTQLFAGQLLTITGEAVDDGEYVWWPVELVDDPSITGYIAEDFFTPIEESGQ